MNKRQQNMGATEINKMLVIENATLKATVVRLTKEAEARNAAMEVLNNSVSTMTSVRKMDEIAVETVKAMENENQALRKQVDEQAAMIEDAGDNPNAQKWLDRETELRAEIERLAKEVKARDYTLSYAFTSQDLITLSKDMERAAKYNADRADKDLTAARATIDHLTECNHSLAAHIEHLTKEDAAPIATRINLSDPNTYNGGRTIVVDNDATEVHAHDCTNPDCHNEECLALKSSAFTPVCLALGAIFGAAVSAMNDSSTSTRRVALEASTDDLDAATLALAVSQ
jgi:hypothetical protein